jgi:predicted GIY-YIG superfamily endonuclease
MAVSSKLSKSDALKMEYRIKQLPTDQKITVLKIEGEQGDH